MGLMKNHLFIKIILAIVMVTLALSVNWVLSFFTTFYIPKSTLVLLGAILGYSAVNLYSYFQRKKEENSK